MGRGPLAGRQVYDVGAGCGQVTVALRDVGLSVLPFDLHHRLSSQPQTACTVAIANGVTTRYRPGSVVLLARPCHGPFASAVCSQAKACGVWEVAYVGFGKNLGVDLGRWRACFDCALRNAGRDHESVFVARLP